LVTSGSDGQILVWNTETGDLVHSMREPGVVGRAVFSPDGQLIASAGTDNTAHLWNVATGQEMAALFGHTAEVTWLAFTPDGSRLITASRDHTVRVWDVSSGESLFVLDQGVTDVLSIAVSPDGRKVLIAALDGFGHMQFLPLPDLLAQARQAVSRELTCTERVLYLHEKQQCD
jgi:WD40 repeat protein